MSLVIDYIWNRREDILLFAASLLIALVLFIQLDSSAVIEAEREIEVPLEFTNVSDEVTVLQAVRKVKVRATAPQSVLDSLDLSQISAFVDLTNAPVGVERYKVMVTAPSREGLIVAPMQSFVQIEVEARVSKEFEVMVLPMGVPPQGFLYQGATVVPQIVTVSGPESIMESVKSVRAVLDLSELVPNATIDSDLEILGDLNRRIPVVQANPAKVKLSPAVSFGTTTRKLLINPDITKLPPGNFEIVSVTVDPVQIEVFGVSADLAKYTIVDTEPIDLSDVRESRSFQVGLILPERLTAEGDTTVTVRVVVRRR